MTDDQLAEIAERLARATPGPWQVEAQAYDDRPEWIAQRRIHTAWNHAQLDGPAPVVTNWTSILTFKGQNPSHGVAIEAADAQFIAHAPEDIAALLREVRALQQRLSADFARAGECVG